MAAKACFSRHLSPFSTRKADRPIPLYRALRLGCLSDIVGRAQVEMENASTSVHPPVRPWCWTQTQQQKKQDFGIFPH